MIEKMKKLSLIIYHSSKDKLLGDLQDLGVVHLETNSSIQNEEIIAINEKITKLKKGVNLLNDIAKTHKVKLKQVDFNGDIEELLSKIDEENDKLSKFRSDLENINKEINLLTPWGTFDPAYIEELEEIGIKFKYYSTNASTFEKMDKTNLNIEVINKTKGNVYFVVVYRDGEEIGELDAVEQRIPVKNINDIYKESVHCQYDITNQQKILIDYTKYIDCLSNLILENTDNLEYDITDASLTPEAEGKILIIKGWVPDKLLKDVKVLLDKEDVVYLLDDPAEDDNVPVLLKNGPFAKLFEPITKMHSLPQYTEIDPTPFFAPFFAAFFGLCLADVGYGLILLAVVLLAFVFIRTKKLLPTLMLGLVVSLTTIGGGYILDTFFGTKITEISIVPESVKSGIVFGSMYQAMGLSLLIGIVQVFLGFFLQATNRFRKYGVFGIFHPLSTIIIVSGLILLVMPFLSGIMGVTLEKMNAGPIMFGYWLSLIPDLNLMGKVLFFVGLIFLLLFNNLEAKFFIRPLSGLWEFYGLITGVPGDILSYIRLFALGLAGGLLGNAFNQIAFMLRDAIPILPLAYIGMALIMLVGHGLNLALAALSAFVHPLRLILLEFYKSVDFTGGGLVYSPFKNRVILKNK